ncbi:hypothetical protein [Planomonospora venezuelensis]|uniref:Uncharacterized protein n=1 Tax=Planomonospora venezuelensis TaxID=1999 RepID=A0A841DBH5_PLAVE|nr:hypothetical protein [Planomonospora venezuelensis]MBB5968002.1 hypothetical protein [Planomonospora venezuelensis]GIN02458.1 hypothetical protein Pve01_41160 [Planomonospora venezuelensis]
MPHSERLGIPRVSRSPARPGPGRTTLSAGTEFCVGKSTQKLVDEIYGDFELLGNVEVTDDPLTVFGPVVRQYGADGYLRVTAGLLCSDPVTGAATAPTRNRSGRGVFA